MTYLLSQAFFYEAVVRSVVDRTIAFTIENEFDESTRRCLDCGCEGDSYEFEQMFGQPRCPDCNSCEISEPVI